MGRSKTARVLRVEMQARNIPSDFPLDTVESAVDYSYVMIGENRFCFRSMPRLWVVNGVPASAATTSLTSVTIRNLNPRSRFFIDFARTSHQCATRPRRPKL